MRALILNRRDIKNPLGGGAEVYTHEAAKAMVAMGLEVTHFSCAWAGCSPDEHIDGVRHLRRGSELMCHLWGFLHALKNRRHYDLIIDEVNGLGFFTFLIPGARRMVLMHQLYKEFWLRELGPLGAVPYVLEPVLLWFYRKTPVVTVSPSTRGDLLALGFKDVSIVMNALDFAPLPVPPTKEPAPTLMFLGRLRSTKRPEDAIEIFRLVQQGVPNVRLWMAGTGPAEAALKQQAMGLEGVDFLGRVDNEKKLELLARAHVLLVPGVREGFGINVIEAAAQGTPAVGYDIHGLRDSIQNGYTGLLARGPADAAQKVARLLNDKTLHEQMVGNCLLYALGFRWDARAQEFQQVVRRVTGIPKGR